MSKSLLNQQAEKLVQELLEIVDQKWALSTTIGSSYLKIIYDDISKLNQEEENEEILIDSDKLANLSKCNQYVQKLKLELSNFYKYKLRIEQIIKNIENIFEMECDYFSNIDKNEFKKDLLQLKTNINSEYSLKSCLVDDFLFKSRLKEESQTVLASIWINQPYINDYLNFKIISIIKNNLLKK